ncbi:MAG: AraC family transcriptional regulator [Lachnospiraceae bacterium]|nr:AraC family transcriptional regulator [Lachnospiraceae bacterium]
MEESFKQSNKVERKSLTSLSVVNVGRQKCTPGYQWGPGVRDHYLIHYISEGRGTYTTGGQTYPLVAGDTFLATPDTEILYRADEEEPWTYSWVGFTGTDAPVILGRTDFSDTCPVLKGIPYGKALEDQLAQINAAFGNGFPHAVEMAGQLYLLLSIMVKNASHQRIEEKTSGQAENVRHAIDYISSRYSYNISIEEIAAYVGVSRGTLVRQFEEEVHISPKKYVDRFRIRRAADLLEKTDLPIASVAASVGYESGLYFSKVFKKIMHVTPSAYRK